MKPLYTSRPNVFWAKFYAKSSTQSKSTNFQSYDFFITSRRAHSLLSYLSTMREQPKPKDEESKKRRGPPRDRFKTFASIAIFISIGVAVAILYRDNKKKEEKEGMG